MTRVKLELELDADKLANVVTQMEDRELVKYLVFVRPGVHHLEGDGHVIRITLDYFRVFCGPRFSSTRRF